MKQHVGHRIVAFNTDTKEGYTLQNKLPVDLTMGKELSDGTYFLGGSTEFVEHYSGLTDDEDLLLTYTFNDSDIIRGNPDDQDSELLVTSAQLVEARFWEPEVQEEFGGLLPTTEIDKRRNSQRGDPVEAGGQKVCIVRAMDANQKNFHPMDYVFCGTFPIRESDIKRAVDYFEEEIQPITSKEKLLHNVICHMQTCAIYQGEPQKVMLQSVPKEDVYNATNPGEFFYDGEVRPGKDILICDENGSVNVAERKIDKEVNHSIAM